MDRKVSQWDHIESLSFSLAFLAHLHLVALKWKPREFEEIIWKIRRFIRKLFEATRVFFEFVLILMGRGGQGVSTDVNRDKLGLVIVWYHYYLFKNFPHFAQNKKDIMFSLQNSKFPPYCF